MSAAQELRSPYTEAVLTRYVRELFKRLPRLSGFRLGADLTVSAVTVSSTTPNPATRSLYPLVMQLIVELAECHPEVLQHMRHRTFARSSY